MHSTASDGTMTPSQMAEECQKAGLCYAALTDHDCVAGVEEFMARAEQLGIRAVSGVEFSVQYEGELHILGYGVDLGHSRFARECRVLAQKRETRVQEMAEKLCQAGYRISLERIRAHAGGDLIGRPHIAAALVEAGYARDIPDAFQRFLNRGGAGFVERYRLSEEEAICLIHEAGARRFGRTQSLPWRRIFPPCWIGLWQRDWMASRRSIPCIATRSAPTTCSRGGSAACLSARAAMPTARSAPAHLWARNREAMESFQTACKFYLNEQKRLK